MDHLDLIMKKEMVEKIRTEMRVLRLQKWILDLELRFWNFCLDLDCCPRSLLIEDKRETNGKKR